MMHDNKVRKFETDNTFLREKLKVSEVKWRKEIDSNSDLYSTIQMEMKSAREAPSEATDEERKKFLSESNCIEFLNPVNPRGEPVYCMDALPDKVTIYGPDGVMFVKTRNMKTVAMMMRMYANSWENLEIDKLLSDQERKRTISGGSSHSQEDPSTLQWRLWYKWTEE